MTEDMRETSILLSTDGSVPYTEEQHGDILATFSDNVFGSWITMATPGQYRSDLVNYRFSPDFKTLDLALKPGAKFHDDTLIKATDLEFSLLRGLYTMRASFYFGFLGCIKGVTEQPLVPGSHVSGLRILSSSQIRISFRRSCPEILHALTLPYVAPRLPAQVAGDCVHFKGLPIGAGPYRLTAENRVTGEYNLERVSVAGRSPRLIKLLTRALPKCRM